MGMSDLWFFKEERYDDEQWFQQKRRQYRGKLKQTLRLQVNSLNCR